MSSYINGSHVDCVNNNNNHNLFSCHHFGLFNYWNIIIFAGLFAFLKDMKALNEWKICLQKQAEYLNLRSMIVAAKKDGLNTEPKKNNRFVVWISYFLFS